MTSRDEAGQATVELAFSLLVLTIFSVLLVQVGLVVRDQVLVTHAAREAARAAAVDPTPGAAAAAAGRATQLSVERLETTVGARPSADGMVRVTVRYHSRIVMPSTGRVLLSPQLVGVAAMRVEES